jgi:hypothetical protein
MRRQPRRLNRKGGRRRRGVCRHHRHSQLNRWQVTHHALRAVFAAAKNDPFRRID